MLYAAVAADVLKSNDGGKTWKKYQDGFNIPLAKTLLPPRGSTALFAGTPGGLYVSKNGGQKWEDANLWLQFRTRTRRELGGASFLDAFWRPGTTASSTMSRPTHRARSN